MALDMFILGESFVSGLTSNLVNITFILSIVCGISVIVSKNPIVSVLYLIGLFLIIACYLIILGMSFIGLSYLLVYVGAVSILFLFILMLINVRVSELVTDNNNSVPLSIIIVAIFNITLFNLFNYSVTYGYELGYNESIFNTNYLDKVTRAFNLFENLGEDHGVYYISSHCWDASLSQTSHITTIGSVIYTSYPILLMLTSIILLLAMVGAILITIKS